MNNEFVLFGCDSYRTRAYIDLLLREKLKPSGFIFVNLDNLPQDSSKKSLFFDNVTPANVKAKENDVEVITVDVADINAKKIVDVLDKRKESLVIFSGPPAAMVKAPLFNTKKQFLHIHPGKLPDFKGSTTIYYTLLQGQKITATALLLNEHIDSGAIVDQMEFALPDDKSEIDFIFDPYIRAQLLVKVLKKYKSVGKLSAREQPKNVNKCYYVIHPVLKHIAILSKNYERYTANN